MDNILVSPDIDIDLQGILSGLKFDKDIQNEINLDNTNNDIQKQSKNVIVKKSENKIVKAPENVINELDNYDLQMHKENRRQFSEKLETDSEFKKKYMEEQKKKLENSGKTIKTEDEELELILQKIKNNKLNNNELNLLTDIEPIELIGNTNQNDKHDEESLDGSYIGKIPYNSEKNQSRSDLDVFQKLKNAGIFINNVTNLTINFN